MLERIAIIGGGPAGCSAALRCSQLGLRVVVFEAADRYRDKPCGDALLANAITHARAFGLTDSDFRRFGGRPFEGIDLVLTKHTSTAPRQLNSSGWIIPRASLDQALRDSISQTCDVRYNTIVRSVFPTGFGVSLTVSQSPFKTEQFGAAILATGASAKLSRMLDIDGHPRKGFAIRGYAPLKSLRDNLLFEVNEVEPVQYTWSFALEDKVNMGMCQLGRRTTIIKTAFRPLGTMNRMTRFVGGIEPLWSGGPTNWHHCGGVVSCGDSAGLVDPMTGEGLSAAFRSGEMAAQAVADYLGGHGEVSLVNYSSLIRQVFSTKYEAARRADIVRELYSSRV